MKRLAISILALLIINVVSGQKEITNTRTKDHKQIKGSRIFLVPPPGFVEANNFQGFQQAQSSSSIVIAEIPGPFQVTTKGFDEDGLKSQGMTLKEKKEIKINGFEGLFIKTEQFSNDNYFTKYILVFGDSTTTQMIIGIFPKEFKTIENDLIKSLNSVVYEPNLKIDAFSSVNFKVNVENTKFKFAKLITGFLLFTVDGNVPPQSEDKSYLSVGQSFSNIEITDKKLYSLNRVRKLPYNNIKIDESNIKNIEIDGISGFEIIASGTNNKTSQEELIFQVMLYSDNGYYIILANADTDFQNNTDLFRTITQTFKRK